MPSAEKPLHNSSPRSSIGALFVGLALILAYFASNIFSADPYLIPSTYPDAWEVVWTIWWNKKFLIDGELLYQTSYLFHPYGASLFLHATVEGITLPLTWLLHDLTPQRIYLWACVSVFALNLASALMLFRYLSRSHWVADILALVFTFQPALIAHLNAGQLNLLCVFPLLLLFCALAVLRRGGEPRLAKLLLFFSIAPLPFLNLYYLYFAFGVLAIYVCSQLICGGARSAKDALGLVLIACLGLIPGAYKIYNVAQLAASHTYTPDHAPAKHALDLMSYFVPGTNQIASRIFESTDFALNSGESAGYIGYALLVILFICLISSRDRKIGGLQICFALSAIIFFLLSLGPNLTLFDRKLSSLPFYASLEGILPFFPSVPARFKNMVLLSLYAWVCVLLANRSETPTMNCAWAIALLFLAVEIFPKPLQSASVGASDPALVFVRDSKFIRAVFDDQAVPQQAMLNQIIHGKPIGAGFLARRPKVAERALRRNKFLLSLKGEPYDRKEILSGFESLGVQALIVDSKRSEFIGALSCSSGCVFNNNFKGLRFLVFCFAPPPDEN